jgi:ribosomal protein S18 acetylase RimI-like enzyme
MIKIHSGILTDNVEDQIYAGFKEHALECVGVSEFNSFQNFYTLDKQENLQGIVVVQLFWGTLYIKYLFVTKPYRRKGLGTSLIEKALNYGADNNCKFVFVETMSFQAIDFYKKFGFYKEFVRHGFSNGVSVHYLKKEL